MSTLRMVVITDPTTAIGFRLAGVDTYGAEDASMAQDYLRRIIRQHDAGLVVINESFLNSLDADMRRHSEEGTIPVLIGLPAGNLQTAYGVCAVRMMDFIRRIVGWRITFAQKEGTS